jgi:hypothetical protein
VAAALVELGGVAAFVALRGAHRAEPTDEQPSPEELVLAG